MDTYPLFDISNITLSLKNLRIIERKGNRVTYDSFILITEKGAVEIKRLVLEFPTIKMGETRIDNHAVTVEFSSPPIKIIEVEYGDTYPL